jgi:predicted permease
MARDLDGDRPRAGGIVMRTIRRAISSLRNLVSRGRRDRELDDELRAYLDLSADGHQRRGLSAAESRRLAFSELGGPAATVEAVRQARAGASIDRFVLDVRYAIRGLARSRGFATAAVLILTLGIGANAVMFSVVDAALLKPLPYRNADELVDIRYEFNAGTRDAMGYVGLDFNQIDFWRSQASIFSEVLTYRQPRPAVVAEADASAPALVGYLSPEIVASLGIPPMYGRAFYASDLSQPVALVSERFWTRVLKGNHAAIGGSITIERRPYTVIGVMPSTFSWKVGGPTTVAWLPFDERSERLRRGAGASTICRIRTGLSAAEAERAANDALRASPDEIARSAQIGGAAGVPTINLDPLDWRLRPSDTFSSMTSSLRIMFAVVGLVLLIACANVANLLLSRSVARRRELAVRAALGATRGRLLRQLFTEALVLAAVGGAGALALSWLAVRVVPRWVPWQLGLFNANPMSLDGRVLAVCVGAVLLTTLLCSLLPALRASRVNVIDALDGGPRTGTTPAISRLRHVLQAVEVAVTVVLLVGMSLLASSFGRMVWLPKGYDAEGLMFTNISLPESRYPIRASRDDFFQALMDRVRALPSVRGATYANAPTNAFGASVAVDGHENDLTAPTWSLYYADNDFFQMAGISLVQGRTFDDGDLRSGDKVAVIDFASAARYWPGQSALGKTVRMGRLQERLTIVGVAAPVKTRWFLARNGTAQLYLPMSYNSTTASRPLLVRVRGDGASLAAELRSAVQSIDTHVEFTATPRFVEGIYEDVLATPRFYLTLMSVFAALALATAAVGLFAVLNYTVAQRTREIGVRLALGGSAARIRAAVVTDALVPLAGGLAAGLMVAFWLTRFLASQLFATAPHDPLSYVTAATAMIFVAATAAILPARRATRINPVETLRE